LSTRFICKSCVLYNCGTKCNCPIKKRLCSSAQFSRNPENSQHRPFRAIRHNHLFSPPKSSQMRAFDTSSPHKLYGYSHNFYNIMFVLKLQVLLPFGLRGALYECRWIFQAAKGFFDHNSSYSLLSQLIRRASVSDEPTRFQIIPHCLSLLPTTFLPASLNHPGTYIIIFCSEYIVTHPFFIGTYMPFHETLNWLLCSVYWKESLFYKHLRTHVRNLG